MLVWPSGGRPSGMPDRARPDTFLRLLELSATAGNGAEAVKFYLGTHRPNWLASIDVPLFVSHRQLMDRKSLPRAAGRWALDSGAFSELNLFGRFTCGHDRELHVRPLFKGERAWCAHVACDCVEFMKFVPDGREVDTCQCATPDFDDTEQCRRCLRLDLRAPRAAARAAAYDARHGPTVST